MPSSVSEATNDYTYFKSILAYDLDSTKAARNEPNSEIYPRGKAMSLHSIAGNSNKMLTTTIPEETNDNATDSPADPVSSLLISVS